MKPAIENSSARAVCLFSTILAVASCGAESNGSSGLSGEIHACEIAPASLVSQIFSKAVTDASASLETANGKTAFSQCSYRFDGGGLGLSVQIRRSGSKIGVSRQADANEARKRNDSLGVGEDIAVAIEHGTDIDSLGNLAYDFDDNGNYQQLVVYWKDHYSLAIISFGGDSASEMAAARKELAKHVVASL